MFRTWVEVNLDRFAENFKKIRFALPSRVKILAPIKANAYGHGTTAIAQEFENLKVDFFGAASAEEGAKLREIGISTPILVLSPPLADEFPSMEQFNLTPTVCDLDMARKLNNWAQKQKKIIACHIKIDTGMGRLGLLSADAEKELRAIIGLPNLKTEGLFTHLACAEDVYTDWNKTQLQQFDALISSLRKNGENFPVVHALNGAGVQRFPENFYDMVRPGGIFYGLNLLPEEFQTIKVKEIFSLKSRIQTLKTLPPNYPIGYGSLFKTAQKTLIATVPVGYGDGLFRRGFYGAEIIVKGKRRKLLGQASMDLLVAGLDPNDPAEVGDAVTIIGEEGKEKISVTDIATRSKTIPYEITCHIGIRVPRIYKR